MACCDVPLCSSANGSQHFWQASNTLKKEAARSSEKLVLIYQTAWCHILEVHTPVLLIMIGMDNSNLIWVIDMLSSLCLINGRELSFPGKVHPTQLLLAYLQESSLLRVAYDSCLNLSHHASDLWCASRHRLTVYKSRAI